MPIPKKVATRIKSGLKRFRKVLETARNADRSEQDTVTIVTDILAEVFGFDKYSELTGEYAIRGTFCDLAVKVDGKVKYLIEVKAIDKPLKEGHLRQATDYAAKEGIEWIVLTNGVEWQAYRMVFEQPISYEHVFTMDLLQGDRELPEMIYTLSREGIVKDVIEEYHEQRQALNRHFVAAVLLGDPVLSAIRRELRRATPGVRIDTEDIRDVLRGEILKRDIVDSEEIDKARRRIVRPAKRRSSPRKPRVDNAQPPVKPQYTPALSVGPTNTAGPIPPSQPDPI